MNVLLVDDHTLFRESLARLLETSPEWTVVGRFGTSASALAAIQQGLSCDLALLDFDLDSAHHRSEDGLFVARELRRLRPGLPILMVTAGMERKELLDAVRTIGVGVFLKNEPSEELLVAMRRTVRGELWVSSSVALLLIEGPSSGAPIDATPFSSRERRVLSLVLQGLSNKEIAAQLEVSESTTKATLQKLFEKAGVRSRSQLVRFAMELHPELNIP